MKVAIAYFIISGLYAFIGLQYLGVDHKQAGKKAEENRAVGNPAKIPVANGSETDDSGKEENPAVALLQ